MVSFLRDFTLFLRLPGAKETHKLFGIQPEDASIAAFFEPEIVDHGSAGARARASKVARPTGRGI
jgi:hypothetical protein